MAVSPWSKGFSRQSDNDGLVRIKIVDEFMANESPAIKAKIPQRFMSEPAYRAVKKWGDGKESAAIVKEKAERNLSNREWVIAGAGWSMTAMGHKVTPGVPKPGWNASPEQKAKAANVWELSDIFEETHPLGPAWSTDWNPATGTPEWFLTKVKEKVWALKNPGKQSEVDFT